MISVSRIPLFQNSQSQAGQESFVLWVLENKKYGYYLEIGAYHAHRLSNTFILETEFAWSGLSFEINHLLVEAFNRVRKNKAISVDATLIDYENILNSVNAPKIIDYLQVDIEPARNSYKALKKVMLTTRTFSVITFEHDLYARRIKYIPHNLLYKWQSYFLLKKKGYHRVVSNVCFNGKKFEDWYVHSIAGGKNFQKIRNINFSDIFIEIEF